MRVHHGAEVLIDHGAALQFVTITSHRRLSPKASVRVFTDAWPKLRKRYRRACPGSHYCLIPERHQSGTVHAHLLVSAPAGSRFWKDNSAACGMGYIAEESAVDSSARAAWYISKELSKMLGGLPWPLGFRRVRCSRGFPKMPPLDPPGDWRFEPVGKGERLDYAERDYRRRGYNVISPDHAEAWRIIALLETMYDEGVSQV